MRAGIAVRVHEPSDTGEARRQAVRLAEAAGFGEQDAARVALVVTEAAGNLVKHAGSGGTLLARVMERGGTLGLEVLALDGGPGMRDPAQCLRDGYSTAGSPGTGLGAISRLSDAFDLHSVLGGGTVLVARLWCDRQDDDAPAMEASAVHVPKPGQEVCGDAWATDGGDGRTLLMVADGLGHGPEAAEASETAARLLHQHAAEPPERILEAMHPALRSTRGAAVAIAEVDHAAREVRYAGVGNIAGVVIHAGEHRSMISHNGIVGHEMRRAQSFVYAWPEGALLLMHSDGIGTRWSLDRYPGLAMRDPALVAGVLYRDFCRGTDDATVLAARDARPLPPRAAT